MTAADPSPARWTAWKRLARPVRRGRLPWREADAAEDCSEPPDRRQRAQSERLTRGVLRHKTLLDAWAGRWNLFDPRATPEPVRWVLRLAVYEKIFQAQAPDYAIGKEAVALARKAAGERAARFVNAVVRRLLARLPATPQAMRQDPYWQTLEDETRWSIPGPMVDLYRKAYGASADSVLEALAEAESAVWLRVNTLRTTPGALVQQLKGEGVEVQEGELPEALCWTAGEVRPWESPAWTEGGFTVQDLGAMTAAHLLDPRPGQSVADLCAAPGGKTGHLWERMEGRGRLVACEIIPERRTELQGTLERLYGADCGIQIHEDPDALAKERAESFDRVLIDAPCLALGLIRRHPEARWDGRLNRLSTVRANQDILLERGARLVAPGGRLLWMTCSPTRDENEEIILPWLATHPEWSLVDPRPQHAGSGQDWLQVNQGIFRTRPDRARCDGFAMALLERGQAS